MWKIVGNISPIFLCKGSKKLHNKITWTEKQNEGMKIYNSARTENHNTGTQN